MLVLPDDVKSFKGMGMYDQRFVVCKWKELPQYTVRACQKFVLIQNIQPFFSCEV